MPRHTSTTTGAVQDIVKLHWVANHGDRFRAVWRTIIAPSHRPTKFIYSKSANIEIPERRGRNSRTRAAMVQIHWRFPSTRLLKIGATTTTTGQMSRLRLSLQLHRSTAQSGWLPIHAAITGCALAHCAGDPSESSGIRLSSQTVGLESIHTVKMISTYPIRVPRSRRAQSARFVASFKMMGYSPLPAKGRGEEKGPIFGDARD